MAAHAVQAAEAEHVATALLISSFEYDHTYFKNLFSRTNWILFRAGTIAEAFEILWKHVVPVVVVDEGVQEEGWKSVLEKMQELPYTPKLIVTSRLATDDIWADVLQFGGYDLLARPLEQQEVLRSISMAWLGWKYEAERQQSPVKKKQPSPAPASKAGSRRRSARQ